MPRFRLTDEDRERLGAPEVLEFDIERPKLKEIREVHKQCDLLWVEFLQKLGKAEAEAAGILIWLAVRRAGVKVDWEDFDIDIFGMTSDEVDEDSPNQSAPDGATTN